MRCFSLLSHALLLLLLADLGLLDPGRLPRLDPVVELLQLLLVLLPLLEVLGDQRLQLYQVLLPSLAGDVVQVDQFSLGQPGSGNLGHGEAWLRGNFGTVLFFFRFHSVIFFFGFRLRLRFWFWFFFFFGLGSGFFLFRFGRLFLRFGGFGLGGFFFFFFYLLLADF